MKVDMCTDQVERNRWGQITDPDCDRIQDDAMKNQAFIERLQTKLKEWASQLDLIEARLQTSYIPTLEHVLSLDTLRARADEVAAQWVELMSLGMGAREDLREDMERTWEELGQALTNATGHFNAADEQMERYAFSRKAHQCFQPWPV